MPALDRQPVRERPSLAELAALTPRSVPETAPTPLQRQYINLSAVALVLGVVAISALELGSSLGSPLVKLCVAIAGPILLLTTGDATLRIARSARAWMTVDPGRGWFRVAWVAVSCVLIAHRRGDDRRAPGLTSPTVTDAPDPVFHPGLDGRSTEIASGLGVPSWLSAHLNFCSRCGGPPAHRRDPGRGPRAAGLRRLRLHRLRQPPARRHDDPGHRGGRGHPPPAGHRARVRLVGPAGRLPGGRRDREPGGDPRDVRGDRPRRRAGRDRGALLAARGRGRGDRVRGARSSVVRHRTSVEALEVRAFPPDAIPWSGIELVTSRWAIRDWIRLRHPELHPGDPVSSGR